MPLQPILLRKLFAAGAVVAILVATGFYLRGILKGWHQAAPKPAKIPENIAETAKGFTFSKSDGQRMLFTIQASSFQQYKDQQRYELHGASITLYGREGDRADHIYGSDFQYNKDTGDITAAGEVQIDLQADSPTPNRPVQAPVASPGNVVHLKTNGLVFNDKTGIAQTRGKLEFRVPDAEGSAIGAIYNSHDSVLQLKSAVNIVTTGRQKANITGKSAEVLRTPERLIVDGARIEQPPRVVTTDKLTVFLRDNNTVERIEGLGNVHAVREGPKGFDVAAPQAELGLDGESQLRSGILSGGVTFLSKDEDRPAQGQTGKILLTFGGKGTLQKVRAEDSVNFHEGTPAKSQDIQAVAADFFLRGGKTLEKANTSAGPAQILLTQGTTRSTISADRFDGHFSDNRLRSLVGSPDAKIVSSTPGQPDRVSTSREVVATFNARGEIASAQQNGGFHYVEGPREAWAEHARYTPGDETYTLSGSPRITEPDRALSADSVQLSRRNSTAVAQGNVKTTYNQKSQTTGAMLATAEPVHVTGNTMTASRVGGSARYTAARLWRGPDIVQAPSILFDQAHRTIHAESDSATRVNSVFVQTDKKGKTTPVNVTSDRLDYVDSDRKAVFSGNVLVKIEGSTVTADTVQAILEQRAGQGSAQGGSQLDHIVAQGNIQIEQSNRKAIGKQLVYTAREEKFVLTGSPSQPPSIFDAERGQIQGDSLTFFTHDGRVLVGSGESPQPVTETKVQRRE
ncbi:MAG TPA: LPS export ABC transporter periplasmic protein LptC [Candidatus Angelobacter sp.]|nr:LPS export ABC transporter periplasmic protein LptC [Candidatus Angelobacter sp.]